MQTWDLRSIAVAAHEPQILDSARGESRTVFLQLPAGEMLRDHQVHERAHVVVVEGEVEISADGASVSGGPGCWRCSRRASATRSARGPTRGWRSSSPRGPARATPARATPGD